jgi:hypothetical protein
LLGTFHAALSVRFKAFSDQTTRRYTPFSLDAN